jgi:hypothetical protein
MPFLGSPPGTPEKPGGSHGAFGPVLMMRAITGSRRLEVSQKEVLRG